MSRIIYAGMGWLAVGLGLLGVLLPGLPTTIFMILAAFCFAKGSPWAHAWLVERSAFGPMILDWQREGAISLRAKCAAVVTMGLVLVLSLVFQVAWWVIVIQVVCMGPAAVFIWTRPLPGDAGQS